MFKKLIITILIGLLAYPPFSRIIQVLISGRDNAKTFEAGREIGFFFKRLRSGKDFFRNSIQILGPVKAPLYKIANRHRLQIILKSTAPKILRSFAKNAAFSDNPIMRNRHVKVSWDVDPVFML